MKKLGAIVVILFAMVQAKAQFGGVYYQPRPRYARRPPQRRMDDGFKPTINFTAGYGFPNVDKTNFLNYYGGGAYGGNFSQTGPFMGSLDYQFQRNLSLGVLVTSGSVNRNYYGESSNAFVFNRKLQNTAVMLNLVNYLPGTRTVSPYFRAALGANIWNNSYAVSSGTSSVSDNPLPDLAYQVSLGMKVNFNQNTGLFVEAGYGKYILAAGLAFKF